jgi:hypothetical protein
VRSRVARGRPNWWVILAVSLGLMALLVATASNTPSSSHRGEHPAQAAARGARLATRPHGDTHAAAPTTTTTTTTPTPLAGAADAPAALHSSGTTGALSTTHAPGPGVTTTTVTPATTTTTTTTAAPNVAVPADRMQTQGYLNPPLEPSNQYGFTGAGAMDVSVVWSGSTHLTMEVDCPSGDQSVGGTGAMAASLPDASGSCLATVTEPASEAATVTYTISIGPAGG